MRIGCPRPVLTLLQHLCRDNVAIVRLARREAGSLWITQGIRQGCPASGSLWAIAFEGVLRAMGMSSESWRLFWLPLLTMSAVYSAICGYNSLGLDSFSALLSRPFR